VSQGERLVVHMYVHPRWMGPKIDSLLYAISGSLLRNRFVLLLWIPIEGYCREARHEARREPGLMQHHCPAFAAVGDDEIDSQEAS
jgi:hypothetical protein